MNERKIYRTLRKRPEEGSILKKDSEQDYQSPIERNKTLYINLGFVKFGISDRLQGAAIFLTLLLLMLAFAAVTAGIWHPEWAKEVLGWLTTPLMLAIGVAVGRSGKDDATDK